MNKEILDFLKAHSDFELTNKDTPHPRIKCNLTNHEMPVKIEKLKEHLESKKYITAQAKTFDFSKYEQHHVVLSKAKEGKLYCRVTKTELNMIPSEVENHINGRKYKNALEEKKRQRKVLSEENANEKSDKNDNNGDKEEEEEDDDDIPFFDYDNSDQENDEEDGNEKQDDLLLSDEDDEEEDDEDDIDEDDQEIDEERERFLKEFGYIKEDGEVDEGFDHEKDIEEGEDLPPPSKRPIKNQQQQQQHQIGNKKGGYNNNNKQNNNNNNNNNKNNKPKN
ncbi:hypothetical protein DLAC_10803 [Tieghemostelium lacteum]|uniref:Surfeit locus protein 2 n=1 Tax=Tieghemostelium lacteum TaxID=361077 RepID=A0A151Z499_TIELA|nr:hypothetical protein DLAC_10803 [Tieghemostelium lacteum]|eukprot:KYQ88768.1 hypothetical protein DLAC_10803 [Tieghemostelium lacteum]